jgi:hypothetical protein
MAKQILPHGATWPAEHSREQPFTGKSRTATPSNVVRLRASGRYGALGTGFIEVTFLSVFFYRGQS